LLIIISWLLLSVGYCYQLVIVISLAINLEQLLKLTIQWNLLNGIKWGLDTLLLLSVGYSYQFSYQLRTTIKVNNTVELA
jgi:hypothetical protein